MNSQSGTNKTCPFSLTSYFSYSFLLGPLSVDAQIFQKKINFFTYVSHQCLFVKFQCSTSFRSLESRMRCGCFTSRLHIIFGTQKKTKRFRKNSKKKLFFFSLLRFLLALPVYTKFSFFFVLKPQMVDLACLFPKVPPIQLLDVIG